MKSSLADEIEATIDSYTTNVVFRYVGQVTTYAEFEGQANQIAHWALKQGLQAGDTVALFMENRPEYISTWFGLSKIGVVTALINHNLDGEGLAHCVNIAHAKCVVTGADQDSAMASVDGLLEDNPEIWTFGGLVGQSLSDTLRHHSSDRPSREHREHLLGSDLALYVYTSGTTGLPKAARLTHARTIGMMRTFITPCNITSRDRIYIPLPLYHSTGGICAVGQGLLSGASLIIRDKFSATAFWDDCVEYGATSIAYIGEICRYLVNTPTHPKETVHKVRTGFGNGLRPEVWQEFHDRFKIKYLCEFYGSTEGNVGFLNFDGKIGAVGRIPSWLEKQFAHIAFVKFDIESEQPVRGEDGFCIHADPNEAGEVLGQIKNDDLRARFEGYSDKAATEKKILRGVFEDGDLWFRTGDLLRKDKDGYIFFVDRVGDTFRWKGENVATNEVGKSLSEVEGILTANVYGVAVPGADGKAGMAAVTTGVNFNIEELYNNLKDSLPAYAIPLFIRKQEEAETTGTFKYRKVDLVEQGFDPEACGGPVWMLHPDEDKYVDLTPERLSELNAGVLRF